MRVLVYGGRYFDDVPWLWRVLDEQHAKQPFTLVIDGASEEGVRSRAYKSADYWANQWARARGIEWLRYPADWQQFGTRAGMIRNREMRDRGKPDRGIAFPGGNGTANMTSLLREAGIPVFEPRKGM